MWSRSGVWLVLCAVAVAQSGKANGNDSARILALENAWNQAEMKHDIGALDILLGDPFFYTDEDGSFKNRNEWLAAIKSGADEYDQLANSKMEVHFYGIAAVVVGEYHDKIKVARKMVSRSGRFTDTWVQQDGQWKCVASQSTLISH